MFFHQFDIIFDSLKEIEDSFIQDAEKRKKKNWLSAVTAAQYNDECVMLVEF